MRKARLERIKYLIDFVIDFYLFMFVFTTPLWIIALAFYLFMRE